LDTRVHATAWLLVPCTEAVKFTVLGWAAVLTGTP